ncbi:MAG TPA: ABC transporter permease [Gemmatimonadaceae bacterium]|nr:ABC transporter permease [Gemmatimonadaceae bacterium]
MDLGFAAPELTIGQIPLLGSTYRDAERPLAFFEQLAERLERVPGIDGATPVLMTPFAGAAGWTAFVTIEGQDAAQAAANPSLDFQSVLPNYFRTMGVPLQRGRIFTDEDRAGSAPVAVVSEMLANRAWPGVAPIGKRLKFGGTDSPGPWYTVVGVVADTRYRDLTVRWPTLYVPRRQRNPVTVFMAVRTTMRPPAVSATLRAAVSDIDPGERVYDVASIERHIHTRLAQPRFAVVVIAGFSAVCLLLAMVGLYGLISSLVRRRRHEIGVRRALGAQSWHIRSLVLGGGARAVLIGIAGGMSLAAAATRGLRALLFGVEPTDPSTLATTGVVLLVAVVIAACVPLRRATGVDPSIALRAEQVRLSGAPRAVYLRWSLAMVGAIDAKGLQHGG